MIRLLSAPAACFTQGADSAGIHGWQSSMTIGSHRRTSCRRTSDSFVPDATYAAGHAQPQLTLVKLACQTGHQGLRATRSTFGDLAQI